MIPYGTQSLDSDDIQAVVDTLQSSYLTQGPQVANFELAIADYVQAQYAVATSSATAALHIACLALGLTKHDIGWTVPLTFTASANAIRYCGAAIDFVDIDASTGCISVDTLSKKLQHAAINNNLPKLLIVVHYSGISCDMAAISKLCQPYNIHIIEDASHAIGGKYQKKPVGCCDFSDCTIFSFHPVKIITSGEGGMITSNNQDLTEQCRLLRSHGITKNPHTMSKEHPEPWYYEQQQLGFNYRMSDIHAALGLSQLKKINHFVNMRNQQAQTYIAAFAHLPITLLQTPSNTASSWHLFVIRVKSEAKITRKQLYHALINAGIGCQVHYIPVHSQPYYQALGFAWGDFPVTEQFYDNCLSIPIFPDLKAQQRVISQICALF